MKTKDKEVKEIKELIESIRADPNLMKEISDWMKSQGKILSKGEYNNLNILQRAKYKGKEILVVEWTKPIKDFPYPKGFRMAEFQEFVDLYDSGFELDKDGYYFVKHFSKKQQNKEFCLSRLFLDGFLNIWSSDDDLAVSNDVGRVVIVKDKKEMKKK